MLTENAGHEFARHDRMKIDYMTFRVCIYFKFLIFCMLGECVNVQKT